MRTKVILSAGNIAHYHHTALALQKAGWLWKYLCVFRDGDDLGSLQKLLPADLRKRLSGKELSGLDTHRLRTFPAPYLFTQALRRVGLTGQGRTDALFGTLYDQTTRYQSDDADVFHFVNGMGLRTAQRAKAMGSTIICDVRAEHVDVQEQTLRLEYDRLSLSYRSLRALYRDRLVMEYELADFLLVPSSYVAETLTRSGIAPEKVRVVPYGVNPSRFLAWQSQQAQVTIERPFRILFVGQVLPLKGVHYLVQAFSSLRHSNMELVIIGHGDVAYTEVLKKAAPADLPIRFLGHIPHTELWRYYLDSDVLVLPSLSDSFGLVVSEAMTAGLPVIVSENTGAKEIIRDGLDGFIIPVRDANALLEKLTYLYTHPQERQTMGESAMRRVREFTWECYGERLIAIYDRILTEKRC